MEHYFTNNTDLPSNFRTIIYKINGSVLEFTSDLGVFSKNKVDYGSDLLIRTFLNSGISNRTLLDVGCGYGIIGITLSKLANMKSTLVDVNKRAVHLTNMNIKSNGVDAVSFESNIYDNIECSYDVIITNPPIRAGKKVVLDILLKAKEHLSLSGELWLVIRKDQGAKSILETLKTVYDANIVEKSKGFYIIVCKNC